MSLYYLLARGWIQFGNGEAWLRSLSVVTAVLSIPVIYAVGTVLSRKNTGLIAAFLLSINVAHIAYAQEARSYSLLVLLCLLSLFFFLRIDHAGNANALGYVLASALAVYAHFFAVFFLFAQWTSLLWLPNKRLYWKRFFLPVSATAVLILPALYYMAFRRSSQLAFIPPLKLHELAQVIYVLTADAGKFRKPHQGDRAVERLAPRSVDAGRRRSPDRSGDLLAEQTQGGALVRHDLAAEQVEALHARRALVDAVELLVAQPGLGEVLARVAVAAVDLHGEHVGLEALLGGEALDDGGQHVEKEGGAAPLVRRRGAWAARSA